MATKHNALWVITAFQRSLELDFHSKTKNSLDLGLKLIFTGKNTTFVLQDVLAHKRSGSKISVTKSFDLKVTKMMTFSIKMEKKIHEIKFSLKIEKTTAQN